MSTFAEKIAAAKSTRQTIDVPILLVADLIAEKDRLEKIIAADDGDARLAATSPADEAREALAELEARAGEGMVTLRFTQIPGDRWTAIASKHLPRPGVPVDEAYGYDFDAVTDEAAGFVDSSGQAYGTRLEGDEEVPMSAADWAELYDVISGHEVSNIRQAIWGLNVWFPKQKIENAGKALGAAARSEKN